MILRPRNARNFVLAGITVLVGGLLLTGGVAGAATDVGDTSKLKKGYDKAEADAKKFCAALYKGEKNADRRTTCQDSYLNEIDKKCENKKTSEKNFYNCVKNKKNVAAVKKTLRQAKKKDSGATQGVTVSNGAPQFQCGTGDKVVMTKINLGCVGDDYDGDELNPILDMVYALIKLLSVGVGIVVVGSIIYAGIQYSSSQGNPEATQAAKNRIQNALIGLVFYMFIFAIAQWLVPGGVFATVLPSTNLGIVGGG